MDREPQRTCVGCRAVADQRDLVRLAWDERQQQIVQDVRRVLPGRGAYLHADPSCFAQAVRRRAIGRAMRRPQVDHEEISIRLTASWENFADSR